MVDHQTFLVSILCSIPVKYCNRSHEVIAGDLSVKTRSLIYDAIYFTSKSFECT